MNGGPHDFRAEALAQSPDTAVIRDATGRIVGSCMLMDGRRFTPAALITLGQLVADTVAPVRAGEVR